MSRRTSIIKAIANILNEQLTGDAPYSTDIHECAFPYLKFWDEVQNYPSIYLSPGFETREYLPAAFAWGFLNISLKVYTKNDTASEQLENLLEDIELALDSTNGVVIYDTDNNYSTTEISITSITTDEGLLAPYAVGEINILVRYQIM